MLIANAPNGVTEVLLLHGDRLTLGERVPRHGAFGHSAECGDLIPLDRHLAVFEEGQIPHHGVGDQRAVLAGDDRGAVLVRGEPVDQVVDQHSVGETTRHGDHVLVFAP